MKNTLYDDMGRFDPDLTPQHDKVMFRLETYAEQILVERLIDQHHSERPPDLHDLCAQGEDKPHFSDTDLKNAILACPLIARGTLEKTEWEIPLNKARLFLDFAISIMQPRPTRMGFTQFREARPRWFHYGFEVKPRVFSIGQTLRQLKTYRLHFHGDLWLVAPADDHLQRIVKKQGFSFLPIPPNTLV